MEASLIKDLKRSRVGDDFFLLERVSLSYCSGKEGTFQVVGGGYWVLEIETMGLPC